MQKALKHLRAAIDRHDEMDKKRRTFTTTCSWFQPGFCTVRVDYLEKLIVEFENKDRKKRRPFLDRLMNALRGIL